MKAPTRRIDRVSIERATHIAKDMTQSYIEKVEALQADVGKKDRQEECKCKACFYFHKVRIGGAAMTSINCGICETEMMFGSTAVEPICKCCAKKNELCVQCGGDIDMKNKRKPRDYENN
jgi:hypothetical protein